MVLVVVCQGPGVVSAMTNALGLGTGTHMSAYLSWQNAEHSRHVPNYRGEDIPEALRYDHLPASLVEYNHWLEAALAYKHGDVASRVLTFMGFVMGFRHDHPVGPTCPGQVLLYSVLPRLRCAC